VRVELREVEDEDLPARFEFGREPFAVHMAAFTAEDPSDRTAFDARWAKLRADATMVNPTIVAGPDVVGCISCFTMFGKRQVSYWVGRAHRVTDYATEALRRFLNEVAERPLFAQAAADNVGSRCVLETCGFVLHGRERGFAVARGEVIEEVVMILNAGGA
jgi:RimJ/RimL family protein N-acetyltransferase